MKIATRRPSLSLLGALAVATVTLLSSSSAYAYKNWNNWYPLDHAQGPGQRAVNPWGDPEFPGQSLCKYASTPPGLPANFEGSSVQYFLNWWDVTPTPNGYAEIMSIRGPNGTKLDLWAHGKPSGWRVFYDPFAVEDCTIEDVEGLANRHQAGPKRPLVWKLPDNAGQVYETNLVCMAVFGDATHPYDYEVVSAASYEWVDVVTVAVLGQTVHAANYYYTSDLSRCLPGYEEWDKTRNFDGITVDACVRVVENYSMEKQLLTPYTGGMFELTLENRGQSEPFEVEDGDGMLFSIEQGGC